MQSNLRCTAHQADYIYFCAHNQWHFDPLCAVCLPQHSQMHAKKKTAMNIVAVADVIDRAMTVKNEYLQKYQQKQLEVSRIKQRKLEECHDVKTLRGIRKQFIEFIEGLFDNLQKEILAELTTIQTAAIKDLQNAHLNIEANIAKLNNIRNELSVETIEAIKKVYFKENAQIYLDEIEQTLKEYQNNIFELCLYKFNVFGWKNKLLQKGAFMMKIGKQEPKKEKPKQELKQKPKQPQKRRCKECNSELEYLTDMKKHLVCRQCGNNERNYLKR